MKDGVRSIILASPTRTSHAQSFIQHIRRHHAWLVQGPNKAIFQEITGSASTPSELTTLTRTPVFHRLIRETNSEEAENLIGILEESLIDRATQVTSKIHKEGAPILLFANKTTSATVNSIYNGSRGN